MAMEIRKKIIVDIDNTILTQNVRKQVIIEKLFKIRIALSEINDDFSLDQVLKTVAEKVGLSEKEVENQFNEVFFGEEYYEKEYFSVIYDANRYLTKISEFADIIYLTARPESMRNITEAQLKEFEFPGGTLVTSDEQATTSVKDYQDFSLKQKTQKIKDLLLKETVEFAIGDTISDIVAYYSNDLQSVLLLTHEKESKAEEALKTHFAEDGEFDGYGVLYVKNWKDIYDFAVYACEKDKALQEIVHQQSADYTSFLNDLDNKSSMILIIATFCATAFFSALTNAQFPECVFLRVLTCLGLATSLLSVFFAIQAFSSRVTHGQERITKIMLKLLSKSKEEFLPQIDREAISKSKFAKNASIKYLYKRYGSLDEKEIKNKILYYMRAANYEKIYSEFKAKICLFATIFIMMIVAIVFLCC